MFWKKKEDSPEVKVHKLEIEKLELKDKLKKEQSEKTGLAISVMLLLFVLAIFLIINA